MRRIKLEDTLRTDSLAKKLWDLTWGLVLVVGLTVVSEWGLLGYSKTPAGCSGASEPAGGAGGEVI